VRLAKRTAPFCQTVSEHQADIGKAKLGCVIPRGYLTLASNCAVPFFIYVILLVGAPGLEPGTR
jgi:hypothetical protein